VIKYPLLWMLAFYKKCISPILPPACRYEPTCSMYMAIAVRHRGAIMGLWLGCKRLLRCQPFGGHGWDPVPGVDEDEQRKHVTPGSPHAPPPRDDPAATSPATASGRTEAAG
jgi:putative membrane protein insertion efficiency factor